MRTLTCLAAASAIAWSQPAGEAELFEKRIRPILAANCQACHNAKLKTAQLDLSSAEGFAHGGQSGPLVSRDKPAESRLLAVVRYDEKLKMPPTGKLKAEEIAALTEWVERGAWWPGAPPAIAVRQPTGKNFTEEEKRWWAFQPVGDPAPPRVRDEKWIATPVDRFVLAGLEAKGLRPAAPADKATLLRRVSYDLTGLPPSEREIREFLADESPEAYRKVVERLLASPRYGEKWGRHWLDLARYADSTGNDEDHRYPHAWRYRDYVIESFNNDVPYDRFVREQIAGDLMPAGEGVNRRGIVATGLLALGAKAIAQQDKTRMLYDVYDEQLDVVSRSVMGLTMACARCHDHKFDPILTRDYYSMVSIFASTKSFADAQAHVSTLLFSPLVPKEEYAVYRSFRDRFNAARIRMEAIVEEEKERFAEPLAAQVARYMVAARRVAEGATLAATAAELSLHQEILKKWVEYLGPAKGYRPHLDDWTHASPEATAMVAREYQARFEEHFAAWRKKTGEWRRKVAEGRPPYPPRPAFEPEDDGFFHGVYIDRNGPYSPPERERDKEFRPEAVERIRKLRAEMEEIRKATPPEPDMACAVEEGQPVAQKVFIRGDYNNHGEDAPKGFPLILSAYHPKSAEFRGSGRMELAEWLTRPDHPLTPRVMANRIWLWHFGEGVVRTPDNFGRMGELPSNPELLDFLARRFVESGWSVKAMHRLILYSSAYRMSTRAEAAAQAADADNRLLSRFPRRRLQVEEIRDGMLAIDDTLDLTMGGTLQKGAGTDSENSQDRLSIRFDQQKRRTVYLPLRRANLPSLLNLFDFGDATTPAGRRLNTNVAPQALFMLNSAFLEARSEGAAKAVMKIDGERARVESAWLRIVNRPPATAERDAAIGYLAGFRARAAGASELDAWKSYCRILLASNDFIFLD
jgi:mono/diheme cytochrome c family protein